MFYSFNRGVTESVVIHPTVILAQARIQWNNPPYIKE